MKEIGGYFGFEELINNEYHEELIRLNTARNALLYLIKAKVIKKVFIPNYLCDSVSNMLLRNHCKFEYYNINSEFLPSFNRVLCEGEYLYVVNYFGQVTNEKIITLKKVFDKLIVDNTHAFFQRPLKDIDTIYSCRKFFGVPDGSYLSTNIKLNEELETDMSKDRMVHILGRYEGYASDYYKDFSEVDEIFNLEPLKYMSNLTKNILGALDYNNIIQIRNENYTYLHKQLKLKNKLKLLLPNGAFAYPFYMENGVEIRKRLASKKIYIPMLWPNVLHETVENTIEYLYVSNILPLPCDQRYTLKDMQFLVEEIEKCIN